LLKGSCHGSDGHVPRVGTERHRWLDRRGLAAFFFLAYALSWSWAIPLAAEHLVVRRRVAWPTHISTLVMVQGILLVALELPSVLGSR
jgi:hypothetical protein